MKHLNQSKIGLRRQQDCIFYKLICNLVVLFLFGNKNFVAFTINEAEDRDKWRKLGEGYVQQWTAHG